MNKLIEKLRKQAINFCLDKGSQGNLSEEVSEKFAKLIVLECASIAAINQAEDMGWDISEIIKEHFGIDNE